MDSVTACGNVPVPKTARACDHCGAKIVAADSDIGPHPVAVRSRHDYGRVLLCQTCYPLRWGPTILHPVQPPAPYRFPPPGVMGRTAPARWTCSACGLSYWTLLLGQPRYCPPCALSRRRELSAERKHRWRRYRPSRAAPPASPICATCSGPLPAGRSDSRYCSSRCRQQAYRDRRR